MDKVIMDGVDVAGCQYFDKNAHFNCMLDTVSGDNNCYICKDNPNCYYKQLQRLKAENERLKEELRTEKIYSSQIEELEGSLQHAKAENDNLKDDIDKQQLYVDSLEQENERLKEKIIKLSEEKGHLIVENNTLKEANQSLSMLGTDLASANETVRKEFFRADKNKDMWREKTEKLQQTLQEIKTIAEEWMTDYCYLDSFYEKEGCCICHENKDCYSYRLLKALTKTEEENE